MGYYVSTALQCTNPELIASGSTFNVEWSNELMGIKNGITSYHCRKEFLNEAIKELSKMHPDATFTGKTWIADNYSEFRKYTVIIKDGVESVVDLEPGYTYLSESIDDEEYEQLLEDFKIHLNAYIKRIDIFNKVSEEGFKYDFLNDNPDSNGFSSYYTITWENDVHKFVATKRYRSLVKIHYERKDGKELKYKKFNGFDSEANNSIDGNECDYKNLPF